MIETYGRKGEGKMKQKQRILILIMVITMIFSCFPVPLYAQEQKDTNDFNLQSESAILMEISTGQVIYQYNATKRLRPASITKIMTLLLIFEAIESNKISMQDEVVVSKHAASMEGSKVFLEEGETQTVDTMIKCITVSSGNDAAVAMAEHVAGSEEAFVKKMNERAQKLGMKDTHFVNCCGLDADNHYSSALDIAIMSRELVTKHPKIYEYSSIWMDTITHVTRRGSSEFGLSNTNKLIRHYKGMTGLKTGSTSKAKFCLSGTAKRNGVELIAVAMAAPNAKTRNKEVENLLNFGFSNCQVYKDTKTTEKIGKIKVAKGEKDTVEYTVPSSFQYMIIKGQEDIKITKKLKLKEKIKAPIKKGQVLGQVSYYQDQKLIGTLEIKAKEEVKELTFSHCLKKMWEALLFS